MDQAVHDRILELQQASYFRTCDESGSYIVTPPLLDSPIASAFERLTRLSDPVLEVARLGLHDVHEVCCGVDIVDDGLGALESLSKWKFDASINLRMMAKGRC